jgi:methionyl aminopeptidase
MDSSKDHQILTDSTKEAFFNALDIISAGVDIYEVGKVIRNTARKYGVKAIPDLTGHGIGKNMWESPFIFNIPFEHYRLNANRAVAIEPIFTAGNTTTKTLHDNWTIITADRSLSAHYEDTIFIGENGAKVVTYT